MATPRFNLLPATLCLAVLHAFAGTTHAAAIATSSAIAGNVGGENVTVDFPGSATASDSWMGTSGKSYSSNAFASPAMRLSVSATSTGYPITHPRYGASASVSVSDDTTFDYHPDHEGVVDDWVQVGLTGALTGTITGTGDSNQAAGTGFASARVSVSGPIYTKPIQDGGVFVGSKPGEKKGLGGLVYGGGDTITINEFVSTGYFWVPRGEAVSLSASLAVTVYSRQGYGGEGSHGTVNVDFSDTFAFDPYNFFDILTPGVTANSPSMGLVNNQLTSVVPEPSSAVLLALGAWAVVGRRRHRG